MSNIAEIWEQHARRYARNSRDMQSRMYEAVKELEAMRITQPDNYHIEKTIRILKGENNA